MIQSVIAMRRPSQVTWQTQDQHQVVCDACPGKSTFVAVGWFCKEQAAVSHSSTEAETISLDAGVSLGGVLALKLWDLVIDVLRNYKREEIGCTTKIKKRRSHQR